MPNFVYTDAYQTAPLFLGMRAGEQPMDLKLLFSSAFYNPDSEDATEYTLQEAFDSESGKLIFFGELPAVPTEFTQRLEKFRPLESAKMLWLLNPNAPVSDWIYGAIKAKKTESGFQLLSDVKLYLTVLRSGYYVQLSKSSEITLNAIDNQIYFLNPDSDFEFGYDSTGVPIDSDLIVSPSADLGTMLSFQFNIPGGDKLVQWLDHFKVGIRYSTLVSKEEPVSINYPIFSTHSLHGGMSIAANITISNLTSALASQLTALPEDAEKIILVSNFRTVTGRTFLFKFDDSVLGFNFAPMASGDFYLAPEGKLQVSISDKLNNSNLELLESSIDDIDQELALGSSGTEYLSLTPALSKDLRVVFNTGYPAHVVGGSSDKPTLSSLTTTSYLKFYSSGEIQYYAQPRGEATLYKGDSVSTIPEVPILPYLPMQAADIPVGDSAPYLPIVPLAGIERSWRDIALRVENSAVSPARKAILGLEEQRLFALGKRKSGLPQSVQFNDEGKFTAITPKGLEAGFSEEEGGSSTWDYVQLARMLEIGGNSGQLRFAGEAGIVEPLKSALLTNEQFIVISDPQAIAPFFSGTDTAITLRDWQFLLDPSNWDDHGTILIIKNSSLSVGELIADTGAWGEAAIFNKSALAVSKRLQKFAADARSEIEVKQARFTKSFPNEGSVETDLDFFVNVVLDSPKWNGILFLNGNLGQFPDDLAGMRAGIQPGKLKAHHLGVTQTPFRGLEELLETPSSMFGLIRYEDRRKDFGSSPQFNFRVRDLGVVFRNSDISDFRAFVDLAMGPLFGQTPKMIVGGPAIVEMEGIRHKREAGDTYNFTSLESIELRLGSGPLQSLCIEQGEFVTSSIDPDAEGMTRTIFSFAGSLTFSDLAEDGSFDLFSFNKLAFNDLVVHMDFANNAPNSPFYLFDIENLQCDESLSEARSGSLFEGFPVRTETIFFNGGKTPGELGNMTVQLPVVPGKLPKNWYGLSFNLDMGTLSDAAGAAGLESKLLLAWGAKKNQYYIGLEISGLGLSGSGNELSLLGVLKLKTYSLSLRKSENVWALLMHGMKLGVFSKSLPASGSFDFYIFGNPDPSGASGSLGWYGAYVEDEKEKAKSLGFPERAKLVQLSKKTKFINPSHANGFNNQEH